VIAAPVSAQAMAAVATPAARNAKRPTQPAANSSVRPVSSSVRVCRTTVRMLMTAMKIALMPTVRHAVYPPAVERFAAGPRSSENDGFDCSVAEREARSASVGYSDA